MPVNSRSTVPTEKDLLCGELEVGDLGELGADEERHREKERECGHQEGDEDGLGHVELGQVRMDDAAVPATDTNGECLGFCTADFWSSLAYESAEQHTTRFQVITGYNLMLIVTNQKLTI